MEYCSRCGKAIYRPGGRCPGCGAVFIGSRKMTYEDRKRLEKRRLEADGLRMERKIRQARKRKAEQKKRKAEKKTHRKEEAEHKRMKRKLEKLVAKGKVLELIDIFQGADERSNVRSLVASALGELGDERAVESLGTALKTDKSIRNRMSAAIPLGKIGGKRAVDILLSVLKQDALIDIHFADEIIAALGETKDKYVVGPLLELLEEKNLSYGRGRYTWLISEHKVKKSLGKITGLGSYKTIKEYEKWYEENQE